MRLALNVDLIAPVHHVKVRVTRRNAEPLKRRADSLVVVESGHTDARRDGARRRAEKLLRRVAMAAHREVRRLILVFRGYIEDLVCQLVCDVVEILVGAADAQIPRSRVVEELPDVLEHLTRGTVLGVSPKIDHVPVKVTG